MGSEHGERSGGLALVPLRKRSQFLRVRGGARCATAAFVLEAKARDGCAGIADRSPRVGLTVTKKLGSAVHRNRIKRRLRSLLRELVPVAAKPGFDYVVIARPLAETLDFDELRQSLTSAFARVHARSMRSNSPKGVKSDA